MEYVVVLSLVQAQFEVSQGRGLALRHFRNREKDYSMLAEPWVSVDDVANHLRFARDSIYRWVERRVKEEHQ
jgi:hypothetical protein